MNNRYVLLGIVVAVLVVALRQSGLRLWSEEPDPSSREFLSSVADEINTGLPMMIDKETELMNTMGLEGTIVYNYRLVNHSADQIEPDQLIQALRPQVTNAACTTPQTRDAFLKKGISMRYTYSDRDRVHVAEIEVTPEDCDF